MTKIIVNKIPLPEDHYSSLISPQEFFHKFKNDLYLENLEDKSKLLDNAPDKDQIFPSRDSDSKKKKKDKSEKESESERSSRHEEEPEKEEKREKDKEPEEEKEPKGEIDEMLDKIDFSDIDDFRAEYKPKKHRSRSRSESRSDSDSEKEHRSRSKSKKKKEDDSDDEDEKPKRGDQGRSPGLHLLQDLVRDLNLHLDQGQR